MCFTCLYVIEPPWFANNNIIIFYSTYPTTFWTGIFRIVLVFLICSPSISFPIQCLRIYGKKVLKLARGRILLAILIIHLVCAIALIWKT